MLAIPLQDAPETIPNAIAYQGVPGAYSEVAALATCPGWMHVPCNQFEQVFQVRLGRGYEARLRMKGIMGLHCVRGLHAHACNHIEQVFQVKNFDSRRRAS